MFTFDRIDAQRIAVSTLGALALSATCVLGAVAPAKAATPDSASAWMAQVQNRVATVRMDDARFAPTSVRQAEVALRFAPDGAFAGASLARSSGSALLDKRAVSVANHLAYPPLPVSLRGTGQAVRLQLTFGDGANGTELPIARKRVEVAGAAKHGTQIAAR